MSIPQKRRLIAVFLTFLIVLLPAHTRANNPVNAKTARQLFNTAYNSVYGAQGSTLSYAVNLVGLYKTTGTISMKGKKKRFFEPVSNVTSIKNSLPLFFVEVMYP